MSWIKLVDGSCKPAPAVGLPKATEKYSTFSITESFAIGMVIDASVCSASNTSVPL